MLTVSGLTGDASRPHVAVLNGGGFAIVWMAQNQTSANQVDWNSNVYVQFSGPDPMATTPRIAVNNASGADQAMPEIVATNDGGFVVTWTDERGDANGSGAMAQRFDDGWVRLGEAMVVNTSAQGDQSDAAIAALSNGNLVIAW
ncbi:MAG: hypothetical protein K9G72_20490 [Rhodobacteraceae bacterium]|nr:hypothetical protein [Paracoccaceae bacterium]MCF8521018.1 hypothetical protein [Paracoccaceae bacterium]